MTAEEFAALTENTIELKDLQVRQVFNGYMLSGNRRFLDASTRTEKFSLGAEGVARTPEDLAQAINNFYATGSW